VSGGTDLAARRSNLSDAKRELLAKLARGQAAPASASAIPRRPAGAPAPLSFAQQRIWFIDQLEPGSPAYNIAAALLLSGPLDREALQRSFGEIVRRHEVLRTTFAMAGGEPVQVIHPRMRMGLSITDLSGLPADERDAALREIALDEARQPFDLGRGPVLRTALVRLAREEHALLLTVSHIAADGWSMGLLIRELAALYEAFCEGRPSPLPELPIQYADFALWQRRHLAGKTLEAQLDYWRSQLAGAPPLLELPTDRPRPAVQSFRGGSLPLEIPPAALGALKAVAQKEGATLFMALLAGFAGLLSRYSGQDDILVGSPVANRGRAEAENLLGFFANTLVLRADLSGEPTFRELLGRVRAMARGAYAHQDVPFERLVEELQPERHLSYSPLFQVMLVLQNGPMPPLALHGLTLSALDLDTGTAKFDLLLNVWEEGGGLAGRLEYATDLFDQDRAERMVEHLATLLAAAAAAPDCPVSALPLLSERERRTVVSEWNSLVADYERVCVHEPVEEQAASTPDAVAATFEGVDLTYAELNARANQLAHTLREMGVGPDETVGIFAERSLEMAVAVLGVLKAGGAYVPLDPAYPAERLAYMVEDSGARVVLTQERLAASLPAQGAPVLRLDADWDEIARRATENPVRLANPEHLAYLIYTSGSTGRPKAVAMPHRALANLMAWQLENSRVGEGGRTLQFASLSFDVSFQELFATWWAGGTLVLVRQEVRQDAAALARVLHGERVERLFLPFVGLQHLAEAIEEGAPLPADLKEIVTAGEQLQITRQIAAWLARTPGCTLENQYGPSEGHVVTAHRLAGTPSEWPPLPPIGRPVANVRILLLDRHFEPVPIGVPGHLYIGGEQVVRGYLGRPELTAQKFVPDPFSAEPGARLYATGDKAVFRADGTIQYLGRIDQQVKIRGYRIEPGEVETVLARHPQVKEVVVAVREDRPGQKRLVAYVVPGAGDITAADLRAFLKGELPDYMVPSAFVLLEALPLTPSGKVHRASLPAPEGETGSAASAYVAPRNAVEEAVAGIWMEVLGLPRVGLDDDFFDLGGHSLTATKLMYGVRKAFGVDLPLRTLFESPTVRALSQAVEDLRRGAASTALPVMTLADLEAEAVLDPEIRPASPWTPGGEPGDVFLTGATGFLGAFLLREILEQYPAARVHALVRAKDAEDGLRRIRENLEGYALWDDALAARVVPVVGDLAKPLLGLAPEAFQRLAAEVDLIVHNGAWVNLFYAYSTLKAANVLGSQEVLRLAVRGRVKPVHYVSTAGVFFTTGRSGEWIVREDTPLEEVRGLVGGYVQSKWVAEKLVRLAGSRGVPVAVYRPGRIGGHSRTGLGNPDDLVFRVLNGSIQLGAAPEMDMLVEISPVDWLSRALVRLSRQPESIGGTFHLVNPALVPWSELTSWLDGLGWPVRNLPWDEWQRELAASAESSTDNVLYPLLPVLSAAPSGDAGGPVEPRFDCSRTLAGLAGTGIDCPRLDARLLEIYLSHFAAERVLPPPRIVTAP
jgi:amino acid adenylation domain-containing protein/thioester reductase-like protein